MTHEELMKIFRSLRGEDRDRVSDEYRVFYGTLDPIFMELSSRVIQTHCLELALEATGHFPSFAEKVDGAMAGAAEEYDDAMWARELVR